LRDAAVTDDIIALLKVHEYFRGMPDEVLHDVLRLARVTYHAAGDVVHEANALVTTVGFVLRGKLKPCVWTTMARKRRSG
jgi:hypothetical protein